MLDWRLVTRCCWGINLAVGASSTYRPGAQYKHGQGVFESLYTESPLLHRPGGHDLDFDERAE